MATKKRTLDAVEKDTERHSATARRVYVAANWRRVVIINVSEGGADDRNRQKRRKDDRGSGG